MGVFWLLLMMKIILFMWCWNLIVIDYMRLFLFRVAYRIWGKLCSFSETTIEKQLECVTGNKAIESLCISKIQWQSLTIFRVTTAQWKFVTNITDTNRRRMLEELTLGNKLERLSWRKAASFSWKQLPDPTARRQLSKIVLPSRAALPDDKYAEV